MITFEEKSETPDLERVAELAADIWREHYAGLVELEQIEYMLERFQSAEVMRRQIDEEHYRYFVAVEDGRFVGYCGIRTDIQAGVPAKSLFLSKFYVEKSHRGRGVGRQLLRFALECHNPEPDTIVWLTVNKGNRGSIAAYEKLGFSIVEEIVTEIGDGFVMDDYRMECGAGKILKSEQGTVSREQ